MMKRGTLLLIVACISCHKEPSKTPAAAPAPSTTAGSAGTGSSAAQSPTAAPPVASAAVPPSDRAKQLLDAQVAALSKSGDAIVATFDKSAVVLVPDARAVSEPSSGLRAAITRLGPSDDLNGIKVEKLVAGGNADAVWFSAELGIARKAQEPGGAAHDETTNVRVTELATADAGWKVVAAAFSEATKPMMSKEAPSAIPGATKAGQLAALVAAPNELQGALSNDPSVAVFGTDESERAYGPEASRALIASWSKLDLALEGKPKEVEGKGWGYVEANVNWTKKGAPYPSRMAALLIAVPANGGKWQVAAVQYTSL